MFCYHYINFENASPLEKFANPPRGLICPLKINKLHVTITCNLILEEIDKQRLIRMINYYVADYRYRRRGIAIDIFMQLITKIMLRINNPFLYSKFAVKHL